MTGTMKAVRMHAYGGPEVLEFEDAPLPACTPEDVLVRVRAAAINPVDWKIREGDLQSMLHYRLPLIPGWDVAGEIVAIGADVETWAVGDAIISRPDISREGAYAEYIAIKANEIAPKPKTMNWLEAAAVPLAALTAWQCFELAGLRAGQTVLVHAASGGVGHFAVQLAKARGARVIATCSAANLDWVKQLGADEAIDYKQDDFTRLRDVDAVLDTLGGEVQEKSWSVLRPGGAQVSIITPPSEERAAQAGMRGLYVFVQPNGDQLAEISRLIDNGKVRAMIDSVYPLEQAAEAHRKSQTGHARGKIVLDVAA